MLPAMLKALANRSRLVHRGATMAKRAGKTVKVSVSLDAEDVATLKEQARKLYGGNLSAAFAEAARWIRQREARRLLVEEMGGARLTPEARMAIDAEQEGGARYEPKRGKPKKGGRRKDAA